MVRERGDMYENSVRLTPFAGIEPSPTIARLVSGRKMIIRIRFRPERMLRKPKIHHQPAFCAKTPPRTGPILGAAFGLMFLVRMRITMKTNSTYPVMADPIYLPRSCGAAISWMTLRHSAMVPTSSALFTILDNNFHQKRQHSVSSSKLTDPHMSSVNWDPNWLQNIPLRPTSRQGVFQPYQLNRL